jgi:Spy/CpxP family protein refolding chaperone
MNNPKFLKTVIVLLLLVNLSTISFLWFNKPHKRDAVGDFFTKELQFTAKQKEQFIVLRDAHRKEREALKSNDKEVHDVYFDLLKSSTVDSATVKNLVAEIMKIKDKEELGTFYHFQKVRAICDEKQKQKFDEIIKEAARMIAPRREGQRPPRRDGEDGPPPPRP